jgi:hypothetical protein
MAVEPALSDLWASATEAPLDRSIMRISIARFVLARGWSTSGILAVAKSARSGGPPVCAGVGSDRAPGVRRRGWRSRFASQLVCCAGLAFAVFFACLLLCLLAMASFSKSAAAVVMLVPPQARSVGPGGAAATEGGRQHRQECSL